MKPAIIFDLDGTLWDATSGISKAWYNILEQYGINRKITINDLKQVLGLTNDEIGQKLFPLETKKKQRLVMSKCSSEELKILNSGGSKLFNNVVETLDLLKKQYNFYIVSNCQSGYIETFINYYKLKEYFNDFECSGNTNLPKAKNIKQLIKRNHIKEAVYVGDTMGDYESSKEVGIPFIYASYGYGNLKNQEYSISNFSELLTILKR